MHPNPISETSNCPSFRFFILFPSTSYHLIRSQNAMSRGASLSTLALLTLERSHVNREAVLHIGPEQSLVGLVDLLDRDDFNIGGDVVLSAKIEHLLSFGDAADVRARKTATAHDQAEGRNTEGLGRRSDNRKVAVAAEQVDIS